MEVSKRCYVLAFSATATLTIDSEEDAVKYLELTAVKPLSLLLPFKSETAVMIDIATTQKFHVLNVLFKTICGGTCLGGYIVGDHFECAKGLHHRRGIWRVDFAQP